MPNLNDVKFQRVRKTIEMDDDRVEIYNPTIEEKQSLINALKVNREEKLEISGLYFIRYILPMLTNIDLNGLEDEVIEEIINEPSELLMEVMDEIEIIIKEVLERAVKSLKNYEEIMALQQSVLA